MNTPKMPPTTKRAIAENLAKLLPNLSAYEVEALIETPPAAEMGEFAFPCFTLAKDFRKAPNVIAQDLQGRLELPDMVREARAAGPYLNFRLDRDAVTADVLARIRREGEDYGRSDVGGGENVVIDYASPNIAKHLGIHHLPSAVIGRALYRVFNWVGYNSVGINYLGDWGTSFGKLIAAVERYGVKDLEHLSVADMQDLYVRFSREAEEDDELTQTARDAFRRLEDGEEEALRAWRAFRDVSFEEFMRIYGVLDVTFDVLTGESDYIEGIQSTLDRLEADGVAVESEGALIVPLDEEGMPPCMVRKSDGTSIYAVRDIAAALDRWEQYRFARALYVTGNEQSLHFNQLRAVLAKMGCEWADRIVHVNFGLIKFQDPETGKVRLGSTRRGDILLLDDVLAEAVQRARAKIEENADRFEDGADLDELAAQVGIGAVIFRELSVRRTRDVVFDWDRMLDFEGDTGPYVQYAHARLCSILRKAGQEVSADFDPSRLALPEEWTIVRHLQAFGDVAQRAARDYEPSLISGYLLELCADFSAYYSAGMRDPELRVLCEDGPTRAARLLLVDGLRHVIRSGLQLLGLAAPEMM